jgi:PGF-CTERM protein
VAIWILGKNYAFYQTEAVNSDSSFKYEVKQEDTKTLTSGQYFVVVQHPMANNQFDIDLSPSSTGRLAGAAPIYVRNEVLDANPTDAVTGTNVFLINGAGALQGSDAAEALVQAINDPNVDDTYTKLQFLIEEPTITIVPIGDKYVGDKFTIRGFTNLAVDDEILMQVYSSSFKPTQKSQSGEFSGATGTIKVVKGETGLNAISFDVDASTFKPDEYIVTADAVIQDATGTALFNVLEGPAPTPVQTTVATPVPTTVATPVPTTATPTPTPTPTPGFGALIALIGLGAIAFIVVRRH